jgi:hypothetical protein
MQREVVHMRLSVPELEIGENEGFSAENDIFKRESFGIQLYNLVKKVDGACTLAIDAPWGEGKTTFVKMWRGLLNKHGIKSIYFDAFTHDYHSDPFMALTGEVFKLYDDGENDKKEKFKGAASSVLKTVGRAGLNIGLKALTAGAVDGTCLDGCLDPSDVAKVADSLVDRYVEQQLARSTTERRVLDEFKTHLSKLSGELNTEGPIVFIIDELDRCRPNFALEILEQVKHVFQVENLVFVLVMNREQVEESVRVTYGRGIDATSYLQKFFTLWLRLPKRQDRLEKDVKLYVKDCLEKMQFKVEGESHGEIYDRWIELAEFYDLSLREIEKGLSNYAIIHNSTSGNLNVHSAYFAVYLSIVKVRYPSIFPSLVQQTISFSELAEETQLNSLPDTITFNGNRKHILYILLKYCLADEEGAKSMREEVGVLIDRFHGDPKRSLLNICGHLELTQDRR